MHKRSESGSGASLGARKYMALVNVCSLSVFFMPFMKSEYDVCRIVRTTHDVQRRHDVCQAFHCFMTCFEQTKLYFDWRDAI